MPLHPRMTRGYGCPLKQESIILALFLGLMRACWYPQKGAFLLFLHLLSVTLSQETLLDLQIWKLAEFMTVILQDTKYFHTLKVAA